uniref:Protein krueppel n=1 Tax=Trichogramma kaykai TaxID=54128 RepID=A0ABD2WH43_9HYME
MELEEGEAKICRLCGQCESIYIDIFGEEGSKRCLHFKIFSKINIKIDENDSLPKVICVQCLGKLEFVCDFQEECLRIQQRLRDQYQSPDSDNTENNAALALTTTSAHANSVLPNVSCEEWSYDNDNNRNHIQVSHNDSNATVSSENYENESFTTKNDKKNSMKNINGHKNGNINNNKSKIESSTYHRVLRSQQNQDASKLKADNHVLDVKNDDKIITNVQLPNASITRKLRSRNNSEVPDKNSKKSKNGPKTRKSPRNNYNPDEDSYTEPVNKLKVDDPKENILIPEDNKIQMPTNILNKVLTAITNQPGIDVTVKETKNRNFDTEDISFTVELSKKKESDSMTVLAKVFPDLGSCLVDESIVTFLKEEINEIDDELLNNIVTSNSLDKTSNKSIEKLKILDGPVNNLQEPENLFTLDGEEIHVDDNVEQIFINNQVNYSCKLCKKVYERKDKCNVHVKTHLGIKQYMCILCKAKFVCKSDVMKHIRCSHTNPRPILCSKCPKRFRSKFDLTEHMNVHKGIRPYQCADCDQSYHHKVSLQMHIKSHLPPQNLACEFCGKIFPYRTRLLSHVGSVHMKDKRNFRCRFCYNLYSSLSVLNEHIKVRHATTYTCDTCGKTFKVASKFKAHIMQHSNPKPFVCEICQNRYASKAFLNEHLLKHQGVRKHVCEKCGASFAQASHLAAHRHVHEEKSHACPECGKMFNRRDNMKVHRRRHIIQVEKKIITKQKSTLNPENQMIDREN